MSARHTKFEHQHSQFAYRWGKKKCQNPALRALLPSKQRPPETKSEALSSAAEHKGPLCLLGLRHEAEVLSVQMFINAFLSLQARSQRPVLRIIQCSKIRFV